MSEHTPQPHESDSTSAGPQSSADTDGGRTSEGGSPSAGLRSWMTKQTAAVVVGLLVAGGVGYAIGDRSASPSLPSNESASLNFRPGAPMSDRSNKASSSLGGKEMASDSISARYFSNILTPEPDTSGWITPPAGATRAGYAVKVDEASRARFAKALTAKLGIDADIDADVKPDASVEWNGPCAGGSQCSASLMNDSEGSFYVSLGNWPGGCAVMPLMPKVAEPQMGSDSMGGAATGEDRPSIATATAAPAPTSSGGTGTATSSASPAPEESVSCPSPKPAPVEADVTAQADSWLGILGLTAATSEVRVVRDEGSFVTNAYIYEKVGGLLLRTKATLTYAAGPSLVSASGSFADVVKVADYEVIDAVAAVKRTHDAQWSPVASQQVWAPGGAVPALGSWGVSSTSPAASPQPSSLAGKAADVIVKDPVLSYMQISDSAGRMIFVPAYRVSGLSQPGVQWDVLAVAAKYFQG